jgi:hypothetical protein
MHVEASKLPRDNFLPPENDQLNPETPIFVLKDPEHVHW